MKKILNYALNGLLVIIILILFIPSWRVAFQGWFHGLFLDDLALTETVSDQVPKDVLNWDLFAMNQDLTLFGELKGKPVVLSFWATWCAYCRPELHEIKELQGTFGTDIHYLAVTEEPFSTIETSGLDEDYDFLYFSPAIPSYFDVTGYPTLIILNKNLEPVFRSTGAGGLNSEENHVFFKNLISE